MKTYVFPAVIEEDRFEDGRGAYTAYCPTLKGCCTWGYTREEALKNLQEAASAYVEDMIEAGEAIPVEVGAVAIFDGPAVTVIL